MENKPPIPIRISETETLDEVADPSPTMRKELVTHAAVPNTAPEKTLIPRPK